MSEKLILAPSVVRQERFTRAKLQLQQGEETDSEDEDGEEDQRGHWGSRKKAYYENREVSNFAPAFGPY